jgi:two-component system cell cycle response regulator
MAPASSRTLPHGRLLVRAGGALVAALAVAHVVIAYLGVNATGAGVESGIERLFTREVHIFLLLVAVLVAWARPLLRAQERAAWVFMAIAITSWSAGELYYTFALEGLAEPPFPSLSDAFWLLTPVAGYVTLGLLMRSRIRDLGRELWLDGLIGACAVAAVGAALVFQPVLESSAGSSAAIATNLAYPLSDMLLLAFIVTIVALMGWRVGRDWLWIVFGFLTLALADSIYLYRIASGTYIDGMFVDALWPLAMLLLAASAWQPRRKTPPVKLEAWLMLALPVLFSFVCLGLLVYGNVRPLGGLALVLAAGGLVAAVVRFGVTFRTTRRLMETRRRESVTDSLTDLANRRKLINDLELFFEDQPDSGECALALFDLDGFKGYNDLFGHPAGDQLLARLGGNLDAVVRAWGEAYRLGGDEFCILIRPGAYDTRMVMAAAVAALSEQGDGFSIGASYGLVRLPREADDQARALQLADQRMYAQKDSRRASPRQQMRDLLLRLLDEREPDLHTHSNDVTELASQVAQDFAMEERERDDLLRAAELHDVGKVAIPEGILSKPSSLNAEEWAFMKRHTVIGERILNAAPAFGNIARLVRASHERWDGGGYPDGLRGEEIPLGARIIAVCDAFDAMTTDRPYKNAAPIEDALEELRRCAGGQFDPAVVQSFCRHMEAALASGPSGPDDPPPAREPDLHLPAEWVEGRAAAG